MAEKICVPDIGDFQEVEIIEVLVKSGDTVAVEQSLITLESDKATMDVPSPVAGKIVDVLVSAGDKVGKGSHIANVETSGEAAQSPAAESAQPPAAPPSAAASPQVTAQEIRVPDIGDFKNVEIIEVLVKSGDVVSAEQSLLTLESDKATMDVPSPLAGVVGDVHVSAGDKISEGDLIVSVTASGGDAPAVAASPAPPVDSSAAPAAAKKPASPAVASTDAPPPAASPPLPKTVEGEYAKPHAGPAVRHFARELGVNLSQVRGSGRKGRILKEDVQAHVKTVLSAKQESGASALPQMPEVDFRQFGEIEIHALSRINKLSAANLHRNWLVAPHVTQFAEADITAMEEFRQSMAEEAKKNGYKMTPVAFLLKAAAAALREFPHFNASLQPDGENLILKKYFNIGVAVDTPNGLVVIVLRDVDQKGLVDLARELAEVSTRARAGKLKREEMQGGCFTISSLGGVGGSAFTPILNLPEVAILGVSRAEIKPRWDGEKFVPKRMLPLSLTYDHRVIDGVAGARFITHYADLLGDIRRLAL